MNYLAHAFLAGSSPEALLGNLIADCLQGVDRKRYSEPIQEGIRSHHAIDRFADSHPSFGASRRRLQPPFQRYGGVLVDIFYDHFLALHWERYSRTPLAQFSQSVYGTLVDHESALPPRLQRMLPHMVREDWLTSYRSVRGIERTLQRLSRRAKRENPLAVAAEQLEQHYLGLESDFLIFFPELVAFSHTNSAPEHHLAGRVVTFPDPARLT